MLSSSGGAKLAIDKIEKEPRQATVYNFEVKDFSSYFVSNLGIWAKIESPFSIALLVKLVQLTRQNLNKTQTKCILKLTGMMRL